MRVWGSVYVSAIALFIAIASPSSAQTTKEASARPNGGAVVVTEAHIAFLKGALNLRPAQLPHWAPVEAALSDMAKWQALAITDAELNESARARLDAAVMARLRRIAAAAAPLIRMLDEEQRGTMISLARSAGLEQFLVAHQ